MRNELDSIKTALEPPTVADEKAQRHAQMSILLTWFVQHPLEEISAHDLTQLVGPNYRSRIADARRELLAGAEIVVVRHWIERADGKKQALAGGYMYRPYEPLGRDSTKPQWVAESAQPSLF